MFVLFDTSNYMYRGFVYASDAIADFVRGLDRADSVAVYTFSRNLTRAAPLTRDRNEAIFGLRKAVAGDDSALYNTLLLTLRDAGKVPGRKVIIVFSNGPDNASMVAPDDVRAVAEDEGIPIYVISTNEVNKDPISANVFRRISTRTGGKAYFAKTWQKQVEAFEAIREDLGNSYTVTYYPQPNPNEGFRKISGRDPVRRGQEVSRAGRAPATGRAADSSPGTAASNPRVAPGPARYSKERMDLDMQSRTSDRRLRFGRRRPDGPEIAPSAAAPAGLPLPRRHGARALRAQAPRHGPGNSRTKWSSFWSARACKPS